MNRTHHLMSLVAVIATLSLAGAAYAGCGSCGTHQGSDHKHAKGDSKDHKHAKACCTAAKKDGKACSHCGAETAEVGQPAPRFTLTDTKGNTHALADAIANEKVVVLEWFNPDCPFVKKHHDKMSTMKDLAAKYRDKGVVWMQINSSHYADADFNKKWAEKWDITTPVLVDQKGKVGMKYRARTTPHMFIINREGILVYDGAIDNHPAASKPKSSDDVVNYVDVALTALLANESIDTPKTKPYGCSVKYGKEAKQAHQHKHEHKDKQASAE